MKAANEPGFEPALSSNTRALAATPALYLVGTPIGNLEDITLRALRVLKEVDLIACEDTRHTQKLLNHFGIITRLTSYHEHNESAKSEELVRQIEAGTRIALVTDAGMPGISDPGFRLVSLAIEHDIAIVPIPGACAFLTALAASGLNTESFTFHGFLPSRRGQRRQALDLLRSSLDTEVFYEAPHRLRESLEDIIEVLGAGRNIVVARELTKIHEEFLRGTSGEILNEIVTWKEIRGEVTLLIAKWEGTQAISAASAISVRKRIEEMMVEDRIDEKAALKKVAKERGISKSEAYRELQRSK